MRLTDDMLAQVPAPFQATVQPILTDLVRGVPEALARAHLATLATVPGVTIGGWDAATASGATRLRYSYRLQMGEVTAYVRTALLYRSGRSRWQLSASQY